MGRLFERTAFTVLTLLLATGNSFAQTQGYFGHPYLYRPGNAGIMGIGPGGRVAYQPLYYSSAPYYDYGNYPEYGWRMYGGSGYGSAYYSPNVTGMPSAPEAAPDEAYLQRYSLRIAAAAAAPENPNSAAIDVKVPPGAQLSFQGHQTQQKGGTRFFESPPLRPGETYAYKINAEWTDSNGKKVERTRTVQVHAGDYLRLDLRKK